MEVVAGEEGGWLVAVAAEEEEVYHAVVVVSGDEAELVLWLVGVGVVAGIVDDDVAEVQLAAADAQLVAPWLEGLGLVEKDAQPVVVEEDETQLVAA